MPSLQLFLSLLKHSHVFLQPVVVAKQRAAVVTGLAGSGAGTGFTGTVRDGAVQAPKIVLQKCIKGIFLNINLFFQ